MKSRMLLLAIFIATGLASAAGQQQDSSGQSFRFRTGVELINVTATVTDRNGHFVSGLRREDFRIYEDGAEQAITHFDSERVPVSLGIALDTSGSMDGEKITAARDALNRFLFDLLDQEDEVFLYRFDAQPELVEGWTTDRGRISTELGRIRPRGGTAMYDTVAEAVPMAQSGQHKKKALLVISDGNDTSSQTDVFSLKQMIRETEVLVYAIGIDGPGGRRPGPGGGIVPPPRPPRFPVPMPFPFPGRRNPRVRPPPGAPRNPGTGTVISSGADDPVNVVALRDLTDDSGGRTEIIRSARDLDPATAGIADELSRQYYLGYPASGKKDGKWHDIRVEVRNGSYVVRARRGYIAGTD
ncbi:MAG TPA: VWA domain-containing protein [Vicinamibacterales bacterium]|jgi:Ca-activated chloride channel homolog|nr:VWA domain-containing protein [Vicinamibacterales bacterium]